MEPVRGGPRPGVYEPERVEGAILPTTSVRDVIRKLPIPVVGVPWYLASTCRTHRCLSRGGPLAEQDFGLTEAVEAALEGADIPDERRPAWRSWRSEVFADVYGCLGVGSAFVSALMGFLVDDPVAIAEQQLTAPGGASTRARLRMAFNFAVLRRLDLARRTCSRTLGMQWSAYYGRDGMAPFPRTANRSPGAACSPARPTRRRLLGSRACLPPESRRVPPRSRRVACSSRRRRTQGCAAAARLGADRRSPPIRETSPRQASPIAR